MRVLSDAALARTAYPPMNVCRPDATGAIAESAVLVPYEGYPPLPFLLDAKANGEVATISGGGTFKASEHAAGALEQRLFKFPLLAPYFHFVSSKASGIPLPSL